MSSKLLKLKKHSSFPNHFLNKQGIAADVFRSIDWANHPLGPIESWPSSLKTSLQTMFHTEQPMLILWGTDLYCFFNDINLPSFSNEKYIDAMGKKADEFWKDTWHRVKPQVDLVMNHGQSTWNKEQYLPTVKNNKINDCYWTYGFSPLFLEDGTVGGTLVVYTDVTRQIEAQNKAINSATEVLAAKEKLVKALESSYKELHSFFMQAPIPMFIFEGPEHVFSLVNPHCEKLIGRPAKGKKILEVYTHDEVEFFLPLLDAVYKTGEPFVGKELPLNIISQDGRHDNQWIDLCYYPFRGEDGNIKGLLGIVQDVTDQVLSKRLLESAKTEADKENELKSSFLANMSHEIRTPLNAILGFTDILQDQYTSEKDRQHYLGIITRNGKALIKIIDDILDISIIEAGKLNIELSPVCLSEICKDILEMFNDRANTKGLTLIMDESHFPKFKILSDPIRIRQILVNLIGNAIKFTPNGSVKLRAEFGKMENNSYIISIYIIDTGVGLTSKQANNLFKPFTQADNASTRKFGGTGLGLSLSQKLARALGGDVRLVGCAENQGCIFEFKVVGKVYDSQSIGFEDNFKNDKNKSNYPLYGIKVLLVDDAADNRLLADMYLKREGAFVQHATNGEDAVAKALNNDYDVVLMDIQMPGIDGYEALSILKMNNYKKPVLALTAHAMKEERRRAFSAGFRAHIPKPLNPQELVSSILRSLR